MRSIVGDDAIMFDRLNEVYGVALRFKVGALYATRPWVLIMDDDILPSEASKKY